MESDAFEAGKPDHLHHSLSNAWSSFLSAQHCSREVSAIRRTLDGHIQQSIQSITSLRVNASSQHDTLSAAIAELKSKVEHHAARFSEVAILQASFANLQQVVGQHNKEVSRRVTGLSDRLETQQDSLANLRSAISEDMAAVQEQCRLALRKVESLEAELTATQSEKATLAQKLAALGSVDCGINQTRQGLSGDAVRFLNDILSRRDSLLRLLDEPGYNIHKDGSIPVPMNVPLSQTYPISRAGDSNEKLASQTKRSNPKDEKQDAHRPATAKRKPDEPLESPPKRPTPPAGPGNDIRSLYLQFRDRYKASPPKSDTAFIWEFLTSIGDPSLSKHIQESLAAILPEHVAPSRDTRRRNPQRHVIISRGLTWRKFREALVKIPGPP